MATFMKKNVNMGLLFLLIATLVCFAAFAIYYQQTYLGLINEYENKTGEAKSLLDTLQYEKLRLNQTSYQLSVKSEREKGLSTEYETVRTAKEKLELEKATLQSNLEVTKSDLAQKEAELTLTKNSLEAEKARVAEKETEISSLNSRVSQLTAEKNALCAKVVQLGGTC